MTIPNLVHSYKKRVVEVSLRSTYSIMNEAIRLSEIENGEAKYWDLPTVAWSPDTSELTTFLDTYIVPYLKSKRYDRYKNSHYMMLKLNNGIFTYWAYTYGGVFEVYVRFVDNLEFTTGVGGKDYFVFKFYPSIGRFEPFSYGDKNLTCDTNVNCCNSSIAGYHASCSELIRINGWKIPDDYPFKF